jgi:hypothetical protein
MVRVHDMTFKVSILHVSTPFTYFSFTLALRVWESVVRTKAGRIEERQNEGET